MSTTSANQTAQFEIRIREVSKIQLMIHCVKSSLSDSLASLDNTATLCNAVCWSPVFYSLVLMSFHINSAHKRLNFLTPSPVW